MTRNNLAPHLEWLLSKGLSLCPSLNPTARDDEIDHTARTSALDQPAPDDTLVLSTPLGVSEPVARSENEDIAGNNGTGLRNCEVSDQDMARLASAPRKPPRLLSLQKNDVSPRGLETPKSRVTGTSPVKHRQSSERWNVDKGEGAVICFM